MASASVLNKVETLNKLPVLEDELQSPQRSITDFFKSPPSKKKSKNLTHVFSSTPKDKSDSDQPKLLSKRRSNALCGEIGSPIVGTKKKNKLKEDKDKIEVEENGKVTDIEEDSANKSGISRRVKTKKKKKSKKVNDSLDDQFIQHFDSIQVISDTSTDNINLSLNSASLTTKSENNVKNTPKTFQNEDGQVGKTVKHKSKDVLKNSQQNSQQEESSSVKSKNTVKTKVSTQDTNSTENSSGDQPTVKSKRKRSVDGEIVENKSKKSKLITKSSKDKTKTTVTSKEAKAEDGVKESNTVSYEDYLKELPVDNTDICDGDIGLLLTDDDVELLVPENYPSVEQYFGKSTMSPENVKAANNSLTITADIHQEPTCKEGVFDLFKKGSSKKKMKNNSDSPILLSPNSSCISVVDDEIVFISSEIQEVENDQAKPKITKTEVQVTESPKPKPLQISKESEDFLKSNVKTSAPIKTAQATLCFTKKGLKTDTKIIVKEPLPPMPDLDEIPTMETKLISEKPSKKKSKKDAEVKEPKDSSEEKKPINEKKPTNQKKPVNEKKPMNEKKIKHKKTKKSKVIDVNEDSETNDKAVNEMNNNETSKKKKKKYKVTSLQFDDSKRTPIKMKIKCRKSLGAGNSSLEEIEFTPKSNKNSSKKDSAKKLLVKAQEILVKAKKQKTKKTTEKMAVKTPKTSHIVNRRSSPRLASKPSISLEEVIDIDDDDDENDDDVKIVEEKGKPKPKRRKINVITDTPTKSTKPQANTPVKSSKAKIGTPVKSTKSKIGTPVKTATPKKGSSKVASIFNVKKKQNEPEIVKPPEDPEKVKQRQAFLSSGIPDVVKKQSESTASQVIVLPEYPPFPTDSHIQQLSSSYTQCISKLSIPLLSPLQYTGCNITWSQLQLTQLYKHTTSATNTYFMNFKHHETMSEEMCMKLLNEIKETNPVYPAQLIYESLKTKRLDELNTLQLEDTVGKETSRKPEEPVVITLDGDDDVVKVKKKSKLKRKKEKRKSVEEVKIAPEKPPPQTSSELLWTDKYQPSHSSDIIGNTSDINKLKTWLLEWKHKTHKDARKMKKLLSKQSKSSRSSSQDSQWFKEDSDFDSDDSEEDDRLCNTMLITGQHGIGKTATVYALAQELGYKVFEVNTSSSRNGKKILARLQEATQSHQVAQNKDGIAPPVFGTNDSPLTPKKDLKNKLPTAFSNLFNKAKKDMEDKDTITRSKKDKTEKSNNKKRKREAEVETEGQPDKKQKKKKKETIVDDHLERMSQLYHKDDSNQAGGLNLTSTSVILFDEVDLVFEKDQGFISAIQYFMSTTKIPIILTTTNRNMASSIQARLEIIQFYPPSQRLIASHLQTICLVEGIRCQYKDLLLLVRYYNNDVRRCILAVQFWSDSGASSIQHQYQRKIKPVHSSTANQIDSDEEDFVQSKTRSKRRIIDDDDSNSSTIEKDTPLIHGLCFESVLGLTNKLHSSIDTHVSSFLQENFNVDKLNSTLYCCELLRTLRFNLLHHNILHLVPLPQTCLTKYKPFPVNTTVKKHRRILDSEDYDSETSNNEPPETVDKQSPTKSSESKKEKRYVLKCLSSFSKYYDNMCLLDNLQTSFNLKDLDNPVHTTRIKDVHEPSLIDIQTTYQNSYSWLHDSHTEVMNHIETRSCQSLCEEIQDIYLNIEKKNSHHDESFLEKLSLPVENGATKFQISVKNRNYEKIINEAKDNIISTLPPSTTRHTVSLDYIPYLRTIHQTECFKKVEKAKRRFHHHFDNIGFGLKRSTLSYLDKDLE